MFLKVNWYCFILCFFLTSKISFAQVDSLQKLKEIKVRANQEKNSIRFTQTVDSISFIKTSSYNVADAIRNFAGVNIKDYGGIGGLKTVSVRSLGANHTGVQYDGINLSDAQNGQIDLGKLMLDNVESISLFQAQPDNLLNNARSFSSASLIVVKTKPPVFDYGRTNKLIVKYTGGSFGLINPVIQYHQKLSKNWSFNMNTALQNANGEYKFKVNGDGSDTLAIRKNSKIVALQFDGGIAGKINKNGSLALRLNYYDSERGLPNAVIFYNPIGNQSLWNKDFYGQVLYTQKINQKWDFLLSGKFSNNYTRYNDPAYLNQAGELDNRYTQKEYYQSAATTYNPIKNLKLNYAADVFFTSLYTSLYQYVYPIRTTILQVLGGKYELKKLTFEGNILNTYIKEKVKNGNASPERMVFTPTFAIAYQASSYLLFRGFYKDIFRYPTFNDLYYTNFGNRKLNPEKARQYNAGFVYSKFTTSRVNWFSFSTDFYFNQINDKIIALPNKDLFIWSMYNIGKVNIYGSDFTSKFNYQFNPKSNLQANINYTYQLALDKTDPTSSVYNNQIPYTPPHTITFNTGYQTEKWGVFYNHIFSSGRYYLGENKPAYFVNGFSVSDLSGSYDTKAYSKPLTLSLAINNLFNNNYAIIRSFPMPGTSVRITIKTII